MGKDNLTIDVVLPVHNEGASIAATLREFYAQVAEQDQQPIRFVICEDGSTDDTVPILRALAAELPIKLISHPVRKGYSCAVIDGLRDTGADWVVCVDADGQCDPADLARLVAVREGYDMVVGCRSPRKDGWARMLMSAAFGLVYRRYFSVPLRDPSCPFLLIHRPHLLELLSGNVGILKQGLWWEFAARANALGFRIMELPIRHRGRSSGKSQIYGMKKIPRIAVEHLVGLHKLRRELTRIANESSLLHHLRGPAALK